MKAIVCFFAFLFSTLSRAGGWSGSGGNGLDTNNNIWNVGSTPVEYCLQIANTYPFNENDLEQMIEESLNDWRQFFEKYHLDNSPILFAQQMGRGQLPAMTLRFNRIQNCNNSKQIVFLFGIKNDVIKTFTQISLAELNYGLAIRPDYDHQNFRNGGYIWIENFTSSRKKLKHLIMHELGHIFGMKHNSTFVMDENVAELLSSNNTTDEDLGLIESGAWPFALIPGSQITFSSPKVRLISNDHREGRCEGRNMMPNRILPQGIINRFRLPPMGCHSFHLELISESGDKKIMRLSLQTMRGERFSAQGEFVTDKVRPRDSMLPGIFTNLGNKWGMGLAGTQKVDFPAKGFFMINSEKLAAQIDMNRGLVLEIFFPESGQWFTQFSY